MKMRGNTFVLQRQRDFDDAGDSSSRFKMSDVRFNASDPAWLFVVAMFTQDRRQCVRFDRVANGSSCSVCFDVLDFNGIDIGSLANRTQQTFLCILAWHRHSLRAAVLVQCGGANDAVDVVAVADRGAKRFQQHHAGPFGADVAVGSGVKRFASTVGRQHAQLAERDIEIRQQQCVHTASERHFSVAAKDAFASHVDCHQRR